jgi:hypothetical protein
MEAEVDGVVGGLEARSPPSLLHLKGKEVG